MVRHRKAIRFTFQIVEGPNAGDRCGSFIVWCQGDSTYVTDKSVANTWKTSLHGEVAWQTAEVKESYLSDSAMLPRTVDRAPWKYEPTPFHDGVRLAYVVGVMRHALGDFEVTSPNSEIIPVADRWDELTKANIWMGEPGISPTPNHIGPVLTMRDGKSVWVTRGSEYVESAGPQPHPQATMAQPQVPGIHDVHAPGMLILGVNYATG